MRSHLKKQACDAPEMMVGGRTAKRSSIKCRALARMCWLIHYLRVRQQPEQQSAFASAGTSAARRSGPAYSRRGMRSVRSPRSWPSRKISHKPAEPKLTQQGAPKPVESNMILSPEAQMIRVR